MKRLLSLFFLSLTSLAQAQEKPQHETILEAPEGWRPETISLPLDFAPSIDYKGFEDVRFAPGWSNTTANDYFTYMFVWYLDEDPKLNREILSDHMKAYFGGLMSLVSGRKDLPVVTGSFKKTSADSFQGQFKTFEAFFKKAEITLNITVKSSYCTSTGKHIVRFNFSPKSMENPLWKVFEEIKLKVDCEQ